MPIVTGALIVWEMLAVICGFSRSRIGLMFHAKMRTATRISAARASTILVIRDFIENLRLWRKIPVRDYQGIYKARPRGVARWRLFLFFVPWCFSVGNKYSYRDTKVGGGRGVSKWKDYRNRRNGPSVGFTLILTR